jgi:hypothetical protein
LLEDDNSSASEAETEVYDVGLRVESAAPNMGISNSPATAVHSTSPGPPCLDGWHDINDIHETARRLRLADQEASTSDSMRPYPLDQ